MEIRELRTVADVVEEIGRDKIRQITGRGTQNVSNWIANDRFPPTTFLMLTEELRKRRLKARAELWSMERKLRRTG